MNRHLISAGDLSRDDAILILDTAEELASAEGRPIRKLPTLRGLTVVNLFYEDSTRTRTSFEAAAKRLSADVINLNVGASSTSKGETLLDTVWNLQAMDADMFIVRHSQSGAPNLIARHVKPGESKIMLATLDRFVKRYANDPDSAKRYLSYGESKSDANIDPAELAAYTTVGSLMLNLDETVTKQ